jgi:hypothetical protein
MIATHSFAQLHLASCPHRAAPPCGLPVVWWPWRRRRGQSSGLHLVGALPRAACAQGGWSGDWWNGTSFRMVPFPSEEPPYQKSCVHTAIECHLPPRVVTLCPCSSACRALGQLDSWLLASSSWRLSLRGTTPLRNLLSSTPWSPGCHRPASTLDVPLFYLQQAAQSQRE